jgi:hypothetical protein
MVPSLFTVNDLANPRSQVVIARAASHRSHQVVIAL